MRRRYLGAFLMGVMGAVYGNTGLATFDPPFSDHAYSCRCRPSADDPFYKNIPRQELSSFHRKVCELKGYIRDLEHRILFLKYVYQDPCISLVVSNSLESTFLYSVESRNAMDRLIKDGMWDGIDACLQMLHAAVEDEGVEQCLSHAYFVCKDIVVCVQNIYQQMYANIIQRVSIDAIAGGTYLADVYTAVNDLPIVEVLNDIADLYKKLKAVAESLNSAAEGNFDSWLYSKWITFPLSIGIITIKIVYYFLTNTDKTPENMHYVRNIDNSVKPLPQQGILCSS